MDRARSPAITAFATLLVLATAASSALGAVPQSTVQALRDLWEQTGGPYWSDECWVGSTWNDTDPCDPSSPWTLTQNVVCDASGSAVTELGLPSCNLTGTLPASIGDLVNLTVLEFETNQLSGPIPAEIGNLVNLQYLDLYVAAATTICKQRHDCEHYSLLSSLSSIVRVEHMLTILKSIALVLGSVHYLFHTPLHGMFTLTFRLQIRTTLGTRIDSAAQYQTRSGI